MQCYWENCNVFTTEISSHIQTHIENQKEHKCLWVGCKRFNEKQSSKYTLQAHVRKHTNDRPYQCNKCIKQYTRSDALNKHLKTHAKVEEEMEELISKKEILLNRVTFMKMQIENEAQKRLRLLQEINVASNSLYDRVVRKVDKRIKEKYLNGEKLWEKYLEK